MAHVLNAVDALPNDVRARIRDRVISASLEHTEAVCPLLENDRCTIYTARPIICRSHGLPIQYIDESGNNQQDVCPLNFAGQVPLHTLPNSDLLDIDRLNQMLAIVNQLALEEAQAPQNEARQSLGLALYNHLSESTETNET